MLVDGVIVIHFGVRKPTERNRLLRQVCVDVEKSKYGLNAIVFIKSYQGCNIKDDVTCRMCVEYENHNTALQLQNLNLGDHLEDVSFFSQDNIKMGVKYCQLLLLNLTSLLYRLVAGFTKILVHFQVACKTGSRTKFLQPISY